MQLINMFKPKEISHIILAIIILSFVVSFNQISKNSERGHLIIFSIIIITLIIFINIIAKKITAYYFESNIESKIWHLQQYSFKQSYHFKKPLPAGIIIPFILSVISLGYAMWLAILEFEVNPSSTRVSKRHGHYRVSEMTDTQIGIIAASGVIVNLIASIIGYLIGVPEFARLSIYYAAFSLLPLSGLDGTKIFFGSRVMWFSLVIITAIFLGYAFLLV